MGSALGFSPEGRSVRVWIRGMPGGDETEVVAGTITEVREDGAVLFLREPDREQRWILAVPLEPGWGLQALWFSFIAVDAFELDGRERLGRWFIRLGRRPEKVALGTNLHRIWAQKAANCDIRACSYSPDKGYQVPILVPVIKGEGTRSAVSLE